ncbi:MAG: imidazoleglycerol-phosphate dehydratase HisB [Rhodothermales bacterium]|nr:imidazoleglycerol-phosphate dehydratase HisB [Rhodothermales bacterium]
MKHLVLVDVAEILGHDGLFAPSVIHALVRLHRESELVLVRAADSGERWNDAKAILEREGIRFAREIGPEEIQRQCEDARQGRGDHHRVVMVAGPTVQQQLESVDLGADLVNPREMGWTRTAREILFPERVGTIDRRTAETNVSIRVNLDGDGVADIKTGLGFFDHMLEQIARHSGADISIAVSGDLNIDEHHTIEDTAIGLGQAFAQAIGDKRGVERYAFVLPMDDALARVAFDWSGRSWLVWDAKFRREMIGDMPTEMFIHFFKSFSDAARCNINIAVEGENEHHMIESVFKAFGRCIRQASSRREDDDRIPSTKGVL